VTKPAQVEGEKWASVRPCLLRLAVQGGGEEEVLARGQQALAGGVLRAEPHADRLARRRPSRRIIENKHSTAIGSRITDSMNAHTGGGGGGGG